MMLTVGGINVSIAHFVELGGVFESLHGHNLVLSAQVEGKPDTGLVMDFRALEKLLRDVASLIDHRLIIPRDNRNLRIAKREGMLEIRTPSKRYLIPETDVILLPMTNSTVEEIARFVYEEVSMRLPPTVKLESVSVGEREGKTATFGPNP